MISGGFEFTASAILLPASCLKWYHSFFFCVRFLPSIKILSANKELWWQPNQPMCKTRTDATINTWSHLSKCAYTYAHTHPQPQPPPPHTHTHTHTLTHVHAGTRAHDIVSKMSRQMIKWVLSLLPRLQIYASKDCRRPQCKKVTLTVGRTGITLQCQKIFSKRFAEKQTLQLDKCKRDAVKNSFLPE